MQALGRLPIQRRWNFGVFRNLMSHFCRLRLRQTLGFFVGRGIGLFLNGTVRRFGFWIGSGSPCSATSCFAERLTGARCFSRTSPRCRARLGRTTFRSGRTSLGCCRSSRTFCPTFGTYTASSRKSCHAGDTSCNTGFPTRRTCCTTPQWCFSRRSTACPFCCRSSFLICLTFWFSFAFCRPSSYATTRSGSRLTPTDFCFFSG